MKRFLNCLLFIFAIFVLFVCTTNSTNIDNLDISNLKELSNSIGKSIDDDIPQEYLKNIDVVNIAKLAIQNYYNKKTFEEPEWVRVKNFLTWMDKNKNDLNAGFDPYLSSYISFSVFYRFSPLDKQIFIGSYLGANYLTQNVTGKKFELQIFLRNRCCIFKYGGICIYASNIISAINGAIHEATHMLPVNNKSFIGKKIRNSDILSEEATVFSQLKYGLPLKISDENLLSGARANFRIANRDFITRYLSHLFNEYIEAIPATTEYSQYSSRLSNILNLKNTKTMSIKDFLKNLLLHKALLNCGINQELSDKESKLLKNKVYEYTVNEVYENIYAESIDKLEEKSIEIIDLKSFELFEDNLVPIATIFFKNLKKYADPNIPPVPKGYI